MLQKVFVTQIGCNHVMLPSYILCSFYERMGYLSMNVGPCYYGMARSQVTDGGTAPNMEGSCE
jgi:hypothetical protein